MQHGRFIVPSSTEKDHVTNRGIYCGIPGVVVESAIHHIVVASMYGQTGVNWKGSIPGSPRHIKIAFAVGITC